MNTIFSIKGIDAKPSVIDYIGKTYSVDWGENYQNKSLETFYIDKINSSLKKNISDLFKKYFSKSILDGKKISDIYLTNSKKEESLRSKLSESGYNYSKELREVLPFRGYKNAYQFVNSINNIIESQKIKYRKNNYNKEELLWSEYLDKISAVEKLSSLVKSGELDCIGQVLLIHQSIGHNTFELYNTRKPTLKVNGIYVIPKTDTHGLLALNLGEYYLKIDPAMVRKNNYDYFLQYKVGFEKKHYKHFKK